MRLRMELLQSPISKELPLFDLLDDSLEDSICKACLYWPDWKLAQWEKSFLWGHFLKTVSGNGLFNIMAAWSSRNLKGKVEEWDVHRRLQKALEYYLQFRRPCTCAGLCVCAGFVGYSRVVSCLAEYWSPIPRHRDPSGKTRLIGSRHLRKSLFNY